MTRVEVGTVVEACRSLLPMVKMAKQLLRRKAMAADELARAVPGLASWATTRGWSPLDVAILVATGSDAYAIAAKVTGTRRSAAQVRATYERWLLAQPRRSRSV